ncbi:ATP-dependent helicase [bacterium]|nr:ATP-dependent helicase [bacterium]
MKVDKSSDYKLIFSISNHPYFGVLIEPFVIELTQHKTLSLTYQKLFSGNATHYDRISAEELEWISILDPIRVEQLVKRFSPVEKIRPKEYFHKYFDRDIFRAEIRPYIEEHLVQLLKRLPSSFDGLYTADDINPAAENIKITSDFSKVLFHFRRNEHGTKYFATIKYGDERIPFMKSGAMLLTDQPAFLVAQNLLLRFFDFVEGQKLNVFINRKFILIKPEKEEEYYRAFIRKLMERAPVYAQGFDIDIEKHQAQPQLVFTELKEDACRFQLLLQYGPYQFDYHPTKFFHVAFEWNEGAARFIKVKRSVEWEENKVNLLMNLGLRHDQDQFFKLKNEQLTAGIEWLTEHKEQLEEQGFQIEFQSKDIFSIDKAKMHYQVNEELDWFDLNVKVTIGEQEYPFSTFLKNIRNGNRLFKLKNGKIFLIPESWFAIGEKLLRFKKDGGFRLNKFQVDALDIIPSKSVSKHLQQLVEIKEEQPDEAFKGTLRPYQLEGLSWLMFLYHNRFGGILADDMGLGKTVQTLAFLQKVIRLNPAKQEEVQVDLFSTKKIRRQSLLIAPTSLLYNWESEAAQFVPELDVYIHAGPFRAKDAAELRHYDLIITSYGLIRNDFELFNDLDLLYIVLDESQNIKNRNAKSTQMINKLEADYRLCLTGTPIENSVKDLWSQMNFLNKGLLGSAQYFDRNFVKPIEKKKDVEVTESLKKLVKPFVLRRTKSQVAKDLPDMTEKTIQCPMNPEQEARYEEIKSEYRNQILDLVEDQGLEKSKLSILQGLTKLRLMSNHPVLVDPEWTHGSGKHDVLLEYVQTAVDEGHKILIFSQFVSYLDLLKKDIEKLKIPHLILTGSTSSKDRKKRVKQFQEEDEYPVFLISLKAGGTGLNLTAADYVFIVDPWWNPAVEAQARDRTHRIGQGNKVFSYKFISASTVEEKIVSLQKKKKKIAKDIIQIEENVIKSLSQEDLKDLFK